METNGTEYFDDANSESAQGDLAAIAAVQKRVRDLRWPTWLYPVNGVLLTGLTLAFITSESVSPFLTAGIVVILVAVNYLAGKQMGAPYIIPTSKVFLVRMVLCGALVISAVVLSGQLNTVAKIALVGGVITSYCIAALSHWQSTRLAAGAIKSGHER